MIEAAKGRGQCRRIWRDTLRTPLIFTVLLLSACASTTTPPPRPAANWPDWSGRAVWTEAGQCHIPGRSEGAESELLARQEAREAAKARAAEIIQTRVLSTVEQDWERKVHGEKRSYRSRVRAYAKSWSEVVLRGAQVSRQHTEKTPAGWAAAVLLSVPAERMNPDPRKSISELCAKLARDLQAETTAHHPYVIGLDLLAVRKEKQSLARLLHDWLTHYLKRCLGARAELTSEASRTRLQDAMAEAAKPFYEPGGVPAVGKAYAARAILRGSVLVSASDVLVTVSIWDVETGRLLCGGTTSFPRSPELIEAVPPEARPIPAEQYATGDEIELLIMKGDRAYDYGRDEAALKAYAEAARRGKDLKLASRARALYRLGYLQWTMKKDIDKAEEYTRQALAADSEHARANANLGAILAQRGNYKAAEPYLKKAITLDKTFGNAYATLGTVYAQTNREHLAIESYEKALKLGADGEAAICLNLGLLFGRKGDHEKARQYLKECIRLDPQGAGKRAEKTLNSMRE